MVRCLRGVTLDQSKAFDGNAEFLGGDLAVNDADAGARANVAGEDGDGAIGVNGQITIEIGRGGRRTLGSEIQSHAVEGETDDQRTAGLKKASARSAHLRPPANSDACITALRMRV